mmetsp:Transcript_65137/g.202051  ORF Transcript_65137/g.202051 Transcript_65137/m.202051 type:complete len:122 (+) Transcript_65137:172-537(+)
MGGLLAGVRWFCGEAGRELEPVRCVAPSGDAGRLPERVAVGAVAGRLRLSVPPLPSPRPRSFALTGPPRKAPMPEPPLGALLTGTCVVERAGPAGAEVPRTLLRTPPAVGVVVPLRLPRLG